ncbi:unnamed protein product [Urochloa humidicola]
METPAAARAGGDRLSALPDDVLLNVLSRLTSLQAARTSLLLSRRRWRHLWRAVPRVDIDQREFWTAQDEEPARRPDLSHGILRAAEAFVEAHRRRAEQWDKLEDFADELLHVDASSSPPAPLDAFRLRVGCDRFGAAARRWIRRGLRRCPASLHVRCDNGSTFADKDDEWPVFSGSLIQHASSTCRLRTLRLAGVSLPIEFADAAGTQCPVLEDMELDDCNYYFWRLASRSLRRLSMENCRPAYDVDELVLVVPRIDSLRIRGNSSAPVTSEGDMPVLVTASLTDQAGDRGLLGSLCHARSLNLSRFSTAALLLGGEDDSGDLFPVFHNLRTLVLDRCDVGVECQVLKRFLRSAPSLETLTLRDCAFSGGSRSKKRKARSGENTSSSAYECRSHVDRGRVL